MEDGTEAFTRKYGVEMTPAKVEADELWLFEMADPALRAAIEDTIRNMTWHDRGRLWYKRA